MSRPELGAPMVTMAKNRSSVSNKMIAQFLLEAIDKNDAKLVKNITKNLVENSGGIDAVDSASDSQNLKPLMFAIKKRSNISMVNAVLDCYKGSNVAANSTIQAAAKLAFEENNADVVKEFIKRGFYDISASALPSVKAPSSALEQNAAQKMLEATRALYLALKDDKNIDLEKVRDFVTRGVGRVMRRVRRGVNENPKEFATQGAVPNHMLLQTYVEAMSRAVDADFARVDGIITFFVERGIKVNNAAQDGKKLLQIAVDNLASGQENKGAVMVAISLLENSAGFSLDEKQQVDFVKAVLKFQPEYIKILIAKKFYIGPDFVVDDKPLAQYARECGVDREIVEFIENQPKEVDHVARKKAKILEESLFLENPKIVVVDAQGLEREMVRGVTTEGEIKFVSTKKEGEKTKKYMVKPDSLSNTIKDHYGAKILEALSDKSYVIKSAKLLKKDGKVLFATKWDNAFAGQESEDAILSGKKNASASAARLFGTSAGAGESDWNHLNARESAKNEDRIIRIDSSPFFVGDVNIKDSSHRLVGSSQSLLFLNRLAGNDTKSVWTQMRFNLQKVFDTKKILSRPEWEKAVGDAYMKEYSRGIDENLLKK